MHGNSPSYFKKTTQKVTKVTAGQQTNDELCVKIQMDTFSVIIFAVVMLHRLAGFGYALYKINGKQKPKR